MKGPMRRHGRRKDYKQRNHANKSSPLLSSFKENKKFNSRGVWGKLSRRLLNSWIPFLYVVEGCLSLIPPPPPQLNAIEIAPQLTWMFCLDIGRQESSILGMIRICEGCSLRSPHLPPEHRILRSRYTSHTDTHAMTSRWRHSLLPESQGGSE